MYFPFNPTQNESFNFIVDDVDYGTSVFLPLSAYISKNGGAAVATTNQPVPVSSSPTIVTLQLTAEEMDSLVITVTIFNAVYEIEYGGQLLTSVTIYTTPSQPTTINTNLPNITEFSSFTNPTMQEVLSVMWQGMTNEAAKKKWSFSTFLEKWDF